MEQSCAAVVDELYTREEWSVVLIDCADGELVNRVDGSTRACLDLGGSRTRCSLVSRLCSKGNSVGVEGGRGSQLILRARGHQTQCEY